MLNLPELNAERMRDLQREASNERLVRKGQNEEKRNLMQNAMSVLKSLNNSDKKR